MPADRFLNDVLDKVNAGRVAAGILPLSDLPKGNHSSRNCPLANALKDVFPSVSVGGNTISGVSRARAHAFAGATGGRVSEINGDAVIEAPDEFGTFVSQFDGGRYPQYSY